MYPIETIENGNFTAKIFHDEDCMSPRDWDNLGTLIARGNYSYLGDKHDIDFSDCNDWYDDEKLIRKKFGRDCILIPVYGYSHGELTISTSPFSCPWDSGRLGTIVVSRKDARNNLGLKRLTSKNEERVIEILEGEISTLNQCLTGDVYGYEIEDEDGNIVDSCWGYYGIGSVRSEANSVLADHVK